MHTSAPSEALYLSLHLHNLQWVHNVCLAIWSGCCAYTYGCRTLHTHPTWHISSLQAEKADAERCAAGLAEQLERAQRAAAEAAIEADAARAAVIAKAAAEQARYSSWELCVLLFAR